MEHGLSVLIRSHPHGMWEYVSSIWRPISRGRVLRVHEVWPYLERVLSAQGSMKSDSNMECQNSSAGSIYGDLRLHGGKVLSVQGLMRNQVGPGLHLDA